MNVTTTTRAVAEHLVATGWSPLPLPPRAKAEPPKGYTGYAGRYVTPEQVKRWTWDGNIAIRLPPTVVGVDVDVYHGGSIAELEERYGALPQTVWSTSRDDGSGIALFRVPAGTTLTTNPAQGIDMIQAHHRYMVVSPSIHPDGNPYGWIDEQSGEDLDAPPEPWELPELPWRWIEALSVTKTEAAAAATPDEARAFIEAHTAATFPAGLRGVTKRLAEFQGSRHDTLVETACWALREAAAGLYAASSAVEVLNEWWRRVMDDEQRRDGGEFGAALMWAIAQVNNEPERVAQIADERRQVSAQASPPANVDPATGEIVRGHRNLPPEFWASRPSLDHIRRAAHSRTRCADAVLLFTLGRVAALVHPTTTLPAIVGGRASLNFLGGVVSSSGGGKSTAGAVARDLVPIGRRDVVADVPPGSGEGLAELFFELVEEEGDDGKKRKVKRQTKSAAFIYLDEGQALAEMGNRKGATLLPTLRSAWSGEVIGQSNATVETHRVLPAHSYRMAILVGFQLEYAAGLIDDAPGGTPQRFVFATATDPSVPDEPPEWPGELDIEVPPIISGGRDIVFDTEVADEIRRRSLMQVRGELEPDALDTHRDQVRMKVAALLGILDGRLCVSREDWELAGVVMATSNAVRNWVIEHARLQARRSEDARTAALARRDAALQDEAQRRALISGAKSIARRVHKVGGESKFSVVRAAVASKHRELVSVEDMLTHAVEEKWIKASNVTPENRQDDGRRWVPGEAIPV